MFGVLLLLTAITLIAYAFYKWATINNNYFERRNIKYLKPDFFFGNTGEFYKNKCVSSEFLQKLYNSFPNEPIFGMFDCRTPQYVIRHPDAIKQITIKDFDHFEDHRTFTDEKTDKLWSNTLFFMKGEKWRNMRATLSPAFTGSKMRQTFELVADCTDDVVKHLLGKIDNGERVNIEMKDFYTRYACDVIASCAFGIKSNSIVEPKNEFYTNANALMDFASFKQMCRGILIMILPKLAQALDITYADGVVAKSFRETILETMDIRKKKNIFRPDMINILMQVREGTFQNHVDEKIENEGFATVKESSVGKSSVNRRWNDDEIVAQCFVFLIAGFETTSTMLTYVTHELASNPDIQQKLYEEIVETNKQLGGKRISYDVIQKMKYLDQIICESLRKWPPSQQLDRLCTKDYVYDNGDNLRVKVEKGTPFIIPIYALHHDPKYFPEPERFDPERFSDENKDKILPGTYLPFGVGPRNCVGSRFALMEIKVVLYNMLLNFSFEPNEKTQIPLKLAFSTFTFVAEKGIHLELKPRRQ